MCTLRQMSPNKPSSAVAFHVAFDLSRVGCTAVHRDQLKGMEHEWSWGGEENAPSTWRCVATVTRLSRSICHTNWNPFTSRQCSPQSPVLAAGTVLQERNCSVRSLFFILTKHLLAIALEDNVLEQQIFGFSYIGSCLCMQHGFCFRANLILPL